MKLLSGTLLANSKLLSRTLPANSKLLSGNLPANSKLLSGTLPANNKLLSGTLLDNNLFLSFFWGGRILKTLTFPFPVPANNKFYYNLLLAGRVPDNNLLLAGRVPDNNLLLARRVLDNNFILNIVITIYALLLCSAQSRLASFKLGLPLSTGFPPGVPALFYLFI